MNAHATDAARASRHADPAAQAGRVDETPFALVPGRYGVQTDLALDDFLHRAQRLGSAAHLPFHGAAWLRAWFNTLGRSGGRQPLLIAVQHHHNGADAALLPLVRQRRAGLWWVGFADASVVDYTAPLLADGWQGGLPDADAARHLWSALRTALRGNDVLHLHKMLPRCLDEAGGDPNPLALALPTQRCEMFGNQFSVGSPARDCNDGGGNDGVGNQDGGSGGVGSESDAWLAWRRSLDKRVRKEIERCWRVFLRSPGARFERVTDPARAQALFTLLEQQQSARMQARHNSYLLDGAAFRAFYQQALDFGLASDPADGQVVLTALLDGPHLVSAMLGVANQQRYIGLRQSLGGEAWKNCSPGRLLDEQTARHFHAQGLRYFDFGIGDYAHKDALRMTPIPLLDACVALSWRGVPAALAWRLRRSAKRLPWLRGLWRGLKQRLGG